MGLHLAEGSIHTVQTPFAYLGYKKLNGMAKTALKPINDKSILKHMCGRIVALKAQGVYNGGYEVVKLAIRGRDW